MCLSLVSSHSNEGIILSFLFNLFGRFFLPNGNKKIRQSVIVQNVEKHALIKRHQNRLKLEQNLNLTAFYEIS